MKPRDRKKLTLKEFLYKYRHFSLVSLYGIAQVFFQYCERTVQPKYYMYSSLDNYIPFVKYFVIPYLFWFIYMGIGFVYLGLVSKGLFPAVHIYVWRNVPVLHTLLIFPNGQRLRPAITENDIFSRMIKHIYATDTPTNVAPSIHVYNSIAVHVALINCPG